MAELRQNHIHLDIVLGGAPENAPLKTWKAADRQEMVMTILEARRTLTGVLRLHQLQSGGLPVRFHSFGYRLRVSSDDEADYLKSLLGRVVYLVDHLHPADGSDHAPSVRQMGFTSLGAFTAFNVALIRWYVDVKLEPINGTTT